MAVTVVLSEIQRDTLTNVCNTFVPSVQRDDDPDGFWSRSASDMGVPDAIEQALSAGVPEEQLNGLRGLLDALAENGLNDADQAQREAMLHGTAESSPEALAGVSAFQAMTLTFFYALPDANGRNPNWETLGYPGPRSAPPDVPKTISITRPSDATLVIDADVCVVGSGAGGGVIAGSLAAQGKKVAVLEQGGYYNESDFNQLELWAYENLYYRGTTPPTADGQIILMAGASLGGGTTVNWTNSLRTKPAIREEWATVYGLEGLDGPDYDRHLDAVMERVNVNGDCSDWNGPHQRLKDACEAAGFDFKKIVRNTDPDSYDPENAGFMGFGDQSGSKQSTTKTFLQDAADEGAEFVVRCQVRRVLVDHGHATGVEGTYTDENGQSARVVVNAPQVVVACGSLESPALLLRSEIGGPATGNYLRLHPATGINGYYDEAQKGWWGAPQTGLTDQFADVEDGYGFLVESSHASVGSGAAATPWASGEQHKTLMSRGRFAASFIFLIRDRGHGRVTIDNEGNAVHHYPFDDELDRRIFRRGLTEIAKLHELAGAEEIVSLHRQVTQWKRGEDFDEYLRRLHDGSLDPFRQAIFSAHQMGSCRMGNDPETSVADGWGELHDVKGVWIGDASAFPTASGTNPMITTMALAHRTAEAIGGSS